MLAEPVLPATTATTRWPCLPRGRRLSLRAAWHGAAASLVRAAVGNTEPRLSCEGGVTRCWPRWRRRRRRPTTATTTTTARWSPLPWGRCLQGRCLQGRCLFLKAAWQGAAASLMRAAVNDAGPPHLSCGRPGALLAELVLPTTTATTQWPCLPRGRRLSLRAAWHELGPPPLSEGGLGCRLSREGGGGRHGAAASLVGEAWRAAGRAGADDGNGNDGRRRRHDGRLSHGAAASSRGRPGKALPPLS